MNGTLILLQRVRELEGQLKGEPVALKEDGEHKDHSTSVTSATSMVNNAIQTHMHTPFPLFCVSAINSAFMRVKADIFYFYYELFSFIPRLVRCKVVKEHWMKGRKISEVISPIAVHTSTCNSHRQQVKRLFIKMRYSIILY